MEVWKKIRNHDRYEVSSYGTARWLLLEQKVMFLHAQVVESKHTKTSILNTCKKRA